jgi:RNA polymerase sigma factor (sigma-70 family)
LQSTTAREKLEEEISPVASSLDFAELFREYYSRVYNYLRYRTSSREDAEDLISITFEKAYGHRGQFNAAKASFSTWIFRIAHNTLANYYRSRQRHFTWETTEALPDDLTMPDASPETQVIQQEMLNSLWQGLAQLNERDQEVISLKFAGRLSNQEIGQVMNLNEKHVSVVLLRAMRRLQKQVKEAAL